MSKAKRLLEKAALAVWVERYGRKPIGELAYTVVLSDLLEDREGLLITRSSFACSNVRMEASRAMVLGAMDDVEDHLSPRGRAN
jgi:hypothetical protein